MVGGWGMLGWGADQMTAGGATALSGSTQSTVGGLALQGLGLSRTDAEFAYGLLGLTPATIEAYAINKGISATAAANELAQSSYKPFLPNGLKTTDEVMATPQAQALIWEIKNSNPKMSIDDAVKYAGIYLASGSSLPSMGKALPGSIMVKVVPKGDAVSNVTGFWMSVEQATAISTMSPAQAGKVLGLPAEQAARIMNSGIDYYAISPKPGQIPSIFTSKVAPTTQGATSMPGGMKQVIVPNRNQWTTPVKVNPITLRPPGG
jgi:filamentous hemagglutinin